MKNEFYPCANTGNPNNLYSNPTQNGQKRQGNDVEAIKNSIDILTVIGQCVPNLKKAGHEWEACCPFHDEKTPSFKVNPEKGLWKCFGCGRGGDVITFIQELKKYSFLEAKDFLSKNYLAGNSLANQSFQRPLAKTPDESSQKTEWVSICPVPPHAPDPDFTKNGKQPDATWTYTDENRQVMFYAVRFDLSDGKKKIFPMSFCSSPGGKTEWRWQGIPAPRPLYNLSKIKFRGTDPILVVEGEKTAEAAQDLFPEYVSTTSPNGAVAANQADWGPMRGRVVVIWPDNDQTGRKYAQEVAVQCKKVGARKISIVQVPTDKPQGWDLADALYEGTELGNP